MSALSFRSALRNGSSILALSTIAMIGAPAANAGDGIFGGGGMVASLAERTLSANFYGFTPGTTTVASNILLLYAAIGNGSGLRIFISNDPAQGFTGMGLPPLSDPRYVFPEFGFPDYPYPRIDFGASDSPLPTHFAYVYGPYTTSTYTWDPINYIRTFAGTVSYPTAS